MDHWRAVLPVPVHEVDYEEAVTDLEAVARRLVAACGLEWEPACLEFHRTDGRSARPAWSRSASRSTAIGGPRGETTIATWPICLPPCRSMDPDQDRRKVLHDLGGAGPEPCLLILPNEGLY